MENDDAYERAKAAIMEIYGDTSVGQSTTRNELSTLRDEIDDLLATLTDEDE